MPPDATHAGPYEMETPPANSGVCNTGPEASQETNHPKCEGNPMNTTVQPATDIIQLDADPTPDEEFADYMKAEYPRIKEGSAGWDLVKRGYDQENMVAGENAFDLACKLWKATTGGSPLPDWATAAGRDWRFPSSVNLVSTHARVPLLNTRAAHFEDGLAKSLRTGCMDVLLKQKPIDRFPWVQITRMWNTADGDLEYVEGSSTNLTLQEATELAHVLLMMVDVARESADESRVA